MDWSKLQCKFLSPLSLSFDKNPFDGFYIGVDKKDAPFLIEGSNVANCPFECRKMIAKVKGDETALFGCKYVMKKYAKNYKFKNHILKEYTHNGIQGYIYIDKKIKAF